MAGSVVASSIMASRDAGGAGSRAAARGLQRPDTAVIHSAGFRSRPGYAIAGRSTTGRGAAGRSTADRNTADRNTAGRSTAGGRDARSGRVAGAAAGTAIGSLPRADRIIRRAT
ncbi:MAG: hypothetical protein AB7G13_24990 [Lautropia sp.]